MDLLLKEQQSPEATTTLPSFFNPRSEEEVKDTLKLIDFLEAQCIIQRDKAFFLGDMELVWLMEGERVNFNVCRQSIKWALGLTNKPPFNAETMAKFLKKQEEDE